MGLPRLSVIFCVELVGISKEGVLHVSAFQSLPLLTTSPHRIRRFLLQTWQEGLAKSLTSRKSWYQYPDIDILNTVRVLNRFSDAGRGVHLKEIAGGCQLAAQKKHWQDSSDGMCSFCGQEDTRSHRLLDCPLGSEARAPFQSALSGLVSDESCMLEYPVVLVDPDLQALDLLHFTFPVTPWPAETLALVQDSVDAGRDLHWFTGGSCLFPESPLTRHATYAVVWDLCFNDHERCLLADRFLATQTHPESLQTILVSRSHGEQDILRAELHAVISIIVNIGQGCIHADSQSAIDYVSLALAASGPSELHERTIWTFFCRFGDEDTEFESRCKKSRPMRTSRILTTCLNATGLLAIGKRTRLQAMQSLTFCLLLPRNIKSVRIFW